MKTSQKLWTAKDGWEEINGEGSINPQVVLAFGGRKTLENASHFDNIKSSFPNADILMASTSGEIIDVEVHDDSVAVTAIEFQSTKHKVVVSSVEGKTSEGAAKEVADSLPKEGLRHVFVLSDGGMVNGTSLIKGLVENLPKNTSITGGLAGDAADFQKTLVGLNETPKAGNIVLLGLYGEKLRVGFSSVGGWDAFGPDRIITKSDKNVLYELDGKPALDLYKEYLGEQAEKLPGSALLFPLSMRTSANDKEEVVRTILTIDEEQKSMTFAGDLPEGNITRLMKANFNRLIDGAQNAAEASLDKFGSFKPELALLVSCVGRKLVLGQRIEDEVESVREVIGDDAAMTGFYSYGEIAPSLGTLNCQLHNQTMTITLLAEE
ncbi:MAG: hypothetical protein ACJAWV_000991 [Flammeovirgaceae bacterium]|jgi:hypothetical protein